MDPDDDLVRIEAIHEALPAGARVRLAHDIERYPHFIAPRGALGTLVATDDATIAVRLDEPLEGAEDWDNEVHWYPQNGDDPRGDLRLV